LVVFSDFSLTVPAGQVVSVVGPSGCGKTTLLNLLALLEPADQGEVLIGGRQFRAADVGTPPLGYLFQRDALLPWRTAWQNALLGAECRGLLSEDVEGNAREFFERFGLTGFEHAWPRTLSGGQRQRVALIQNLLISPDILLLDEPLGSLDFQMELVLEEELLGVLRPSDGRAPGERKTVVLVTHDISEAITFADRVLVLGSPPTGILLDLEVCLDEAERTPVIARQSEKMKSLFALIWQNLEKPAHARAAGREV
jgi:NitT/TauT family transport system ATP-binding protein